MGSGADMNGAFVSEPRHPHPRACRSFGDRRSVPLLGDGGNLWGRSVQSPYCLLIYATITEHKASRHSASRLQLLKLRVEPAGLKSRRSYAI